MRSGETLDQGPIFPHTFPHFSCFLQLPQRFDFTTRTIYSLSPPRILAVSNACCDPHDRACFIRIVIDDSSFYRSLIKTKLTSPSLSVAG